MRATVRAATRCAHAPRRMTTPSPTGPDVAFTVAAGPLLPPRLMPIGFIGRVSQASVLKQALDAGSQRTRAIADRVAAATIPGARPGDGFAVPAPGAQPGSA